METENIKSLFIDKEAVATLAMARDGLLKPVMALMNQEEAKQVDKTGKYKEGVFPFSFLLAPAGKVNAEVLKISKKGERLNLVCNDKICGHIIVDEIFPINKDERVQKIYGTNNPEHPGVKDTYRRLGDHAICGDYEVDFDNIKQNIKKLNQSIENIEAVDTSAIILSGKPFHRVHERIIRTALVKCDLLVIFLQKPYKKDTLSYDIRYKTIKYFIDNYLPRDRVVLLPLENTYIFGGFNELTLNALVTKNYGVSKLIIGQNHAGLGAYWEDKKLLTKVDSLERVNLEIEIMSEFTYCDKCTTLVSTNACPHGSHHHVKYHNDSIMELFELGIIPPAILMRKDISSIILSELYPERKNKLKKIHQNLSTSSGLIDEFTSEDFYCGLMSLYQTSSLS
ncbi:MAG: sulfate adenylyltransferase [Campylobacterota bacterium]|nr:sulfate adenylyltransferase [Campylobacterota bacterium]